MSVFTPKIHVATNCVHQAIIEVEKDACSEFPAEAWTLRYIQDASLNCGYLPLVAYEQDKWNALAVAWGCFHFYPSKQTIRITRLATRWSHRRQGIAREIVKQAIEYGHKTLRTEFHSLTAIVMGDNITAEQFFNRLKFGYEVSRVADGSIVTRFKREI